MQRRTLLAASLGLPLVGCATPTGIGAYGVTSFDQLMAASPGRGGASAPGRGSRTGAFDMDGLMAKQQLQMDMMSQPDLPAWHEQREKMALAIGDRTFGKPFDRVFDSMTVALSTLGSRVNNMERTSGYITASIPNLGPAQAQHMQSQATRQYAIAKGYPTSMLDTKGPFEMDMSGMMLRQGAGLTLQLQRQGRERTKVKLRFDNVYYPEMVSEYYKLVWAAVDKQMFLDAGLD